MRAKLLIYFSLMLTLLNPHMIEEKIDAHRGLASSWDIIPARSLAGFHYIYKGYEHHEEQGLVKVTGPVLQITNGDHMGAKIFSNGYSAEMDPEDFEMEQALGKSVFEATTRTGSNVTAFLVGTNIVLTNRHVMAYTKDAKNWSCGNFSIKLNHKKESVACKSVKWCSSRYDYCVVEMNEIGSEVTPLRLSRKEITNKDASLLHIGNAAGLGLQASRGQGIKIQGGEFYHYAPTLGGSSGAPIFNDRGEVIGINRGHTGKDYIGDEAFNRGILATAIFEDLKSHSPHNIKEIKSFRSWFHRIFKHRKVKIESQQK